MVTGKRHSVCQFRVYCDRFPTRKPAIHVHLFNNASRHVREENCKPFAASSLHYNNSYIALYTLHYNNSYIALYNLQARGISIFDQQSCDDDDDDDNDIDENDDDDDDDNNGDDDYDDDDDADDDDDDDDNEDYDDDDDDDGDDDDDDDDDDGDDDGCTQMRETLPVGILGTTVPAAMRMCEC